MLTYRLRPTLTFNIEEKIHRIKNPSLSVAPFEEVREINKEL